MKNRIIATLLTFLLAFSTLTTSIYAEEIISNDNDGVVIDEESIEDEGEEEEGAEEPEDAEDEEREESTDNNDEALTSSSTDTESSEDSDEEYKLDEGEVSHYTFENVPYDNDELFAQYVNNVFGIADEESIRQYSYVAGNNLSGNDLIVYNKLKEGIPAISNGTTDCAIIKVPYNSLNFDKYDYTIDDVPQEYKDNYISKNGSTSDIYIVMQYVRDLYALNVSQIMTALLQDCTYELYWFDKTVGLYNSGLRLYYTSTTVTIKSSDLYDFSFTVSSDYKSDGRSYYTDTTKTGATVQAVKNAKTIINSNIGKNDYSKLVAYKEAICELVSYNNDAANDSYPYGDPWQLVYVFDNDPDTNVVCEGYSKAFKYLCDNTAFSSDEIYCICVDGSIPGGAHMWNVVHMEDGKNYLVDVTNCDAGTIGAPDKLFMRPAYNGQVTTAYHIRIENPAQTTITPFQYSEKCKSLFGTSALTLSTTEYDYSSSGSLTEHQDLDGDEICDHCGQIYGAYLRSRLMSLDGDIGVVYIMDLSDYILSHSDEYYMWFHVNGRDYYVHPDINSTYIADNKTFYCFSCNVAAKEMTDTISAQFYHNDGSIIVKSDSRLMNYEYSVQTYCINRINKSSNEKMRNLAKALLNYGGFAQLYFGHNVDNLANEGLYDDSNNPISSVEKNMFSYDKEVVGNVEGITFVSNILNLESKIGIVYKYALDEGYNIDDYCFTCDEKVLTPKPYQGYYIVEVEDIAAKRLSNVYRVDVQKKGSQDILSTYYSVYTYCYNKYDKYDSTHPLTKLVRAIYLYNRAAVDYFAQ